VLLSVYGASVYTPADRTVQALAQARVKAPPEAFNRQHRIACEVSMN